MNHVFIYCSALTYNIAAISQRYPCRLNQSEVLVVDVLRSCCGAVVFLRPFSHSVLCREGIQTDSSDDNPETPSSTTTGEPLAPAAAAAAVNDSSAEAVSEERLAAATAADARQRAANAALARLASSQSHPRPEGVADGIGVATSAAARVSMDASEEPHRQGTEREEDGVDMEGLTEVAGEAGATLLVAAGVRTLGQLADREEEELTRELGVVQEGGTSTGERSNAAVRVSAEEVSEWVQGAREEELDEIMLDIVGGNEDVVEVRAGSILCCVFPFEYVLRVGVWSKFRVFWRVSVGRMKTFSQE